MRAQENPIWLECLFVAGSRGKGILKRIEDILFTYKERLVLSELLHSLPEIDIQAS